VWLTGFRPGLNWLKTELLDGKGRSLETPFNTTVRLIDYQPGGEDALSKLVRGELSAAAAFGIVDPTYQPTSEPVPGPRKDERKVKKDKVTPSETAPVAIPEQLPSSSAVKSKVQPEEIPEVQPAPSLQPPAVPLPSAEQPSLTREEPTEPTPPVSQETAGSRLQRQFSTYLQRFRSQPRVEPQPEASPVEPSPETSPAEESGPLPLEPSLSDKHPEDRSPAGQQDRGMPPQAAEPSAEVESSRAQPPASLPTEEPAQSSEQPAEPAPALLDQAKQGAGKFLKELGQQTQVQSQKWQRQFGEYLQRFRSHPASSGTGSAPAPSSGMSSPTRAAEVPTIDSSDASDQRPTESLAPPSVQAADQAEKGSIALPADRVVSPPNLDDQDIVGTPLDKQTTFLSSEPDLPSAPAAANPNLWQRLQSLRLEDLARRLQPQSPQPSPKVSPEL
jgi:hypothetical protein